MNISHIATAVLSAAVLTAAEPAFAHHVMGGQLPASFTDGFLSGLGHPVIGLDHLAAVLAVGFIAGAHRAGRLLVIGYVVAMMAGVAVHVSGASVPASEFLVALSVIGLGMVLVWRRETNTAAALILFAVVGLIHGYALGESIYGAERTPLFAYLAGLAIIQGAIGLAAQWAARRALQRDAQSLSLRLSGASIAGIGFVMLVQQFIPAV